MHQPLGLSESTASAKLQSEGPNELPCKPRRRLIRLLIEMLQEPMMSLLLGCGAIYFVLGDHQEAIFLFGFTAILVVITVYQENRTEHAIESLKSLSSPRALVIRDGKRQRIPGRDVVRDDLLVLSEGDRIPADAELISDSNLLIDESILTGESAPIEKSASKNERHVFAGTTIVRGHAMGRVVATGSKTELGKIGRFIESSSAPPSLLELETKSLVKTLALGAVSLCVLIVIVYGLTRTDWLNGFLAGLTLAMAILPNELPAVLIIFLALGAWRISLRHVLTRRMSAVETLGSISALCVDKTGTLTLNRMSLTKLYSFSADRTFDIDSASSKSIPEDFHKLVEYGILASSQAPFDPMEKAVLNTGAEFLAQTEHLHPDWLLTREYPLTDEMRAVSNVWNPRSPTPYIVGTKGAPEAIIDLCHMKIEDATRVNQAVKNMAERGLRVLGVAAAVAEPSKIPGIQHDYDFEFLGLMGFSDPLRSGAREAVAECTKAGIRVLMITGDHERTASTIARAAGLENPESVMDGTTLNNLSDEELAARIKHVSCFARMKPEQKLRIVKALAANGEIVAMTGDGVNDVPALKMAHVGIAMGGRGSDVAREAASIVLLNDDFSSIVDAIRTGRKVYHNLQKAMSFLLAIHVPIAAISVLPVLMGLPMVLLPAHVAFLHLIIEPVCSVVFESEPSPDTLMNNKPRRQDAPLFSSHLIRTSVYKGLVVCVGVFSVFFISFWRGQGELEARALAFTTLVFASVALILHFTKRRAYAANRFLWWTIASALVLLLLVLYIPQARDLFRFSTLHWIDLVICFFAGTLPLAVWSAIEKNHVSS